MMTCNVLFVYADASVQPEATGLGAVIRDERGKLIAWRNKAARPMTCNEAEYAALIFALEQAREFSPREVQVFSDSRVVVEQMRGWISVHSYNLRPLHRQARELAAQFRRVSFTHIPREQNQLADAIADDAIASHRTHPHPSPPLPTPARSGRG
jgi:ribonuclease HI